MCTIRCFTFSIIVIFLISSSRTDENRGLLDFLFGSCKCRCGVPNREARLVGGEYLKSNEFPWASLIQVKSEQGDSSLPATLINDKYLITSAANVVGLTPFDIKVTFGQFDKCSPDVSSTNVSVDKILLHPDFSPENRAHDIALVKLSTPVKMDKRVSSICLATPSTQYLGQVATVSSWAETASTERQIKSSCRPRKLGLPVLSQKECLAASSEPLYVSNDKGCIGVIGSVSPVCKVDTGGAVMYRSRQGVYDLIGVLSDKNECGPKPGIALYTNINDHIYWITQNTRDACYCFKT